MANDLSFCILFNEYVIDINKTKYKEVIKQKKEL